MSTVLTVTCAAAIGLAVIFSSMALRYPRLLNEVDKVDERRKPVTKRIRRMAHRGTRVNVPENTLHAFEYTLNSPSLDTIELDICLTRDGHVVIHHDKTLTRMCGVDKKCSDFDFADLPKIRIPSVGDLWAQGYPDYKEAQIPKLEEVLQLLAASAPMPDGRMRNCIVEFKEGSTELITKTFDLIEKYHLQDRCITFSLADDINRKLNKEIKRRKLDQVATINSFFYAVKIYLCYYLGLLPFITYKYDIFGMVTLGRVKADSEGPLPFQHFFPKRLHWLWRKFLAKLDHRALLFPIKLVDHLKARGVTIVVLGVNDSDALQLTKFIKAHAYLTDGPLEKDCKHDSNVGGLG